MNYRVAVFSAHDAMAPGLLARLVEDTGTEVARRWRTTASICGRA